MEGLTKEWRCTRPSLYGPGTPGHTDPKARQGWYCRRDTEQEARDWMQIRFPHDNGQFDVELWKEEGQI